MNAQNRNLHAWYARSASVLDHVAKFGAIKLSAGRSLPLGLTFREPPLLRRVQVSLLIIERLAGHVFFFSRKRNSAKSWRKRAFSARVRNICGHIVAFSRCRQCSDNPRPVHSETWARRHRIVGLLKREAVLSMNAFGIDLRFPKLLAQIMWLVDAGPV